MVAQGIYAFRPPLPAVIGNEGVGRVLAVGPGVESVKVGDRILAPPASFTWRERIVVSAGGLSALPADADCASSCAGGDDDRLRLGAPVARTYPLSSIKDAVAHAQRGGKILLDVRGSST